MQITLAHGNAALGGEGCTVSQLLVNFAGQLRNAFILRTIWSWGSALDLIYVSTASTKSRLEIALIFAQAAMFDVYVRWCIGLRAVPAFWLNYELNILWWICFNVWILVFFSLSGNKLLCELIIWAEWGADLASANQRFLCACWALAMASLPWLVAWLADMVPRCIIQPRVLLRG